MKSKRINIYCLPFAGGSFYSYREFERYTPDFINIHPIELPGRGKRFSDPVLTNIHHMVNDIFNQIKDVLDEPYAFYGHSLGAYLGYLVVKRIIHEDLPLPAHLFFTGRGGPSVENKRRSRHLLPKQQFIKMLNEFEGTPPEVLKNSELMDLFEPIIRADFQAYETYAYEKSEPFDIPMTVMIGLNDETTYEEALRWQEETKNKISIIQFPGGHFFIFDHLLDVCRIISQKLERASGEKLSF